MVTIKRDSDSSKVTITFRGAVEDDVLCTLYDNEGENVCNNLLNNFIYFVSLFSRFLFISTKILKNLRFWSEKYLQ